MRVNALLVRWSGGYTEVYDTASEAAMGRTVRAFLSIPDVRSEDEMQRIADATFDRYASEQVAFTLTVDPRNGPTPYVNYGIGDTVLLPNIEAGTTTARVTAMMVTEDEEGTVLYAPEVGQQVDDDTTRLLRWLNRMAPGTLGGRSEAATPVTRNRLWGQKSVRRERIVATFSHGGVLTVGEESGDHEFQHHEFVVSVVITARIAGGSASDFDLYHDNVLVADNLTIGAGVTRTEITLATPREFENGDLAHVETVTDGGHEIVVIHLLRNP